MSQTILIQKIVSFLKQEINKEIKTLSEKYTDSVKAKKYIDALKAEQEKVIESFEKKGKLLGNCFGFALCYGMMSWLDRHSSQKNPKNLVRWEAMLNHISDWSGNPDSDSIKYMLPALSDDRSDQKESKSPIQEITLTQIFEIVINEVIYAQGNLEDIRIGFFTSQHHFLQPQVADKELETCHLELVNQSGEKLTVQERSLAGKFLKKDKEENSIYYRLLKESFEDKGTQEHFATGICIVHGGKHCSFLKFDIKKKYWSFYDSNYDENTAEHFRNVDDLIDAIFMSHAGEINFDMIHLGPGPQQKFFKPFYDAFAEEKSIPSLIENSRLANLACYSPKAVSQILKSEYFKQNPSILYQRDNSSSDVLQNAILYGHLELVEDLLERKADINKKSKNGNSVLHYAVQYPEMIELLLQKKLSLIDEKNKNGNTTLYEATSHGFIKTVEKLLEHKADVNKKGEFGNSVLHQAIKASHTQIALLLLEQKLTGINDLNYVGLSPLHEAITKGYSEVVVKLLQCKADPNVKSSVGMSAIYCAIESNHPQIILLLLEQRPLRLNDKYNGLTPLHKAVSEGYTKAVTQLLEHNADPKIRDSDGRTALHLAIKKNNLQMVRLILEDKQGQKILNEKDDKGLTALHFAINKGYKEIIIELLKHNPDLSLKDDNGNTSLHLAVLSKFPGNVEILLESKERHIIINEKNSYGLTPLQTAAKKGYAKTVKKFLDQGVSDIKDKNKTTLYWAVRSGELKTVQLLWEKQSGRPVQLVTPEMQEQLIKKLMDGYVNSSKISFLGCGPNHKDTIKKIFKQNGWASLTVEVLLKELAKETRNETVNPEGSLIKCMMNILDQCFGGVEAQLMLQSS